MNWKFTILPGLGEMTSLNLVDYKITQFAACADVDLPCLPIRRALPDMATLSSCH